jgi:D-serine deaminase-like pyridoxal phosphate-dependent protein
VLIDVDPGLRRTGVADAEAAVALAHTIAASASLRYRGVQIYCGSEQHIEAFADRREALAARTEKLRAVIAALAAAGFAPGIVTGGGTGSHAIDAELGVLTELQAGSYIFMDRQYNDCALTTGNARAFETALFIDARIVSANHLGLATLDAGFKAMATDGGAPAFHAGAPEGATFRFMGDEHGALIAREHRFALGARVTLVAPHCDPTVNLYDAYHVVENETVVDVWPIEARGKGR